MKPKNRVFCNACHRHKILFETEKKAFNFIKFNAEEILKESGIAPVRPYFCTCCGGYHVTSREKNVKKVLKGKRNLANCLAV